MNAGQIAPGDLETASDVLWASLHGVVTLGISMPVFHPERTQKLAAAMREVLFKAFYRASPS